MTPTSRTLKLLRDEGWMAQVVESWIPRLNIRKDLFGVGDVLAVKAGEPAVLLIQTTTAANTSARIHKALAEPRLRTWLASGQRFEVWGWLLRERRWECRRTIVVLDDLNRACAIAPARQRRRQHEPSLFTRLPIRRPQDTHVVSMTCEPSAGVERAISGGNASNGGSAASPSG